MYGHGLMQDAGQANRPTEVKQPGGICCGPSNGNCVRIAEPHGDILILVTMWASKTRLQ